MSTVELPKVNKFDEAFQLQGLSPYNTHAGFKAETLICTKCELSKQKFRRADFWNILLQNAFFFVFCRPGQKFSSRFPSELFAMNETSLVKNLSLVLELEDILDILLLSCNRVHFRSGPASATATAAAQAQAQPKWEGYFCRLWQRQLLEKSTHMCTSPVPNRSRGRNALREINYPSGRNLGQNFFITPGTTTGATRLASPRVNLPPTRYPPIVAPEEQYIKINGPVTVFSFFDTNGCTFGYNWAAFTTFGRYNFLRNPPTRKGSSGTTKGDLLPTLCRNALTPWLIVSLSISFE